ncbi:MAG: hypothetical protein PVH61_32375 [Candidatus Aminicenantes bacterium]|jgi:hypothetical protein
MNLNKISAVITQEQETQIKQLIKNARKILSFLVNLSSEERIKKTKLSRGRVDFVNTSLVHARGNPKYFPGYIDLEEFAKDVELKDILLRIRAELKSFTERIDDTILLVGSEAYQAARLFYKSVKAAAKEGAEDAERIAKDLAYHYKNQGTSNDNKKNNSQEQENQKENQK